MRPFRRTTDELLIRYSEAQKEYTEHRKRCGDAIAHCQAESIGACTFPKCLRDDDDGSFVECEASPEIHLLADASWKAKAVRGKARAAILNRAHALAKREKR